MQKRQYTISETKSWKMMVSSSLTCLDHLWWVKQLAVMSWGHSHSRKTGTPGEELRSQTCRSQAILEADLHLCQGLRILQPASWLQLHERLSQTHRVKPLLNSWLVETVRWYILIVLTYYVLVNLLLNSRQRQFIRFGSLAFSCGGILFDKMF